MSDPQKRELYDQYGEEGVEEGGPGGPGGGFGDIFDLFGGGMRRGGPAPQMRVQPTVHKMRCTLEDVYNGKKTKIKVTRDRLVKKEGEEVPRGAGAKTKQDTKILEVTIDKGSPHGNKYTFHGEGDEYPGAQTGDVIVVVDLQEHKKFKRRGADLLFEKTITLSEALTGAEFTFKHLDGKKIKVKTPKGAVVKPKSLMTLKDMGLPFHNKSFEFGNMFILFTVEFPDTLSEDQVTKLSKVLKGPKKSKDEFDAEVTLEPYSESQRNTHVTGGTQGDDSEDEERGHPGMRGHRME